MLENLQLWIYGAAALIDTVLLFALLERHNWRVVTVWMLLLAVGVWCWHAGTFVRQLVDLSVGPLADPMRWLSMCGMSFGLLLMPSAALHGTFRFLRHGQFQLHPQHDPRLALCYLPLLLMPSIGQSLAAHPTGEFLVLLSNYRTPYSIWLGGVSAFAAIVLFQIARQTSDSQARRFYQWIAGSMVLIGSLTGVFVFSLNRHVPLPAGLTTLVAIAPIMPALLFAYFVMRFQLLPLVLERTLVYGAVLMGAMLFHQVMLRRWLTEVGDRYRLDLGVIEGTLVLIVVLLYQPLRRRVGEALHSLIDHTATRRTDRQRLAVQLASRAGQPAGELLSWFIGMMPSSFGSELSAGWICDRQGRVLEQAGSSDVLADHELQPILAAMSTVESPFVTRYTASGPLLVDFLDRVRAGALLQFAHDELRGMFLIGCRAWGQPPTDEDLHALALLVEQFGVTLHNSRLQGLQLAAEHRVLQQEKLSTLGLIAGSLAHEIKNPLSSIKTITRVLSEELGPESPHAEDLQMIAGEIDRLSSSMTELLDAARPPRNGQSPVSFAELLSPTLRLLQHLARERQAALEVSLPEPNSPLPLDQISLREIVFNLVSNGLEAAGAGGKVQLICRQEVSLLAVDVHDTGPGFTAEQRVQLFEPFFTTKSSGTGLGLYIVARRVKELGGQIECSSIPSQGTRFSLRFPLG